MMVARRRGQPLAALALLATSWIGARALAWDSSSLAPMRLMAESQVASGVRLAPQSPTYGLSRFTPWPDAGAAAAYPRSIGIADGTATWLRWRAPANGMPVRGGQMFAARAPDAAGWTLPPGGGGFGARGSRLRSPGGNAAPFPVPAQTPQQNLKRWSGDAWLLARGAAGSTLASGPAPATYGGSQAGAILRYALAPGSRYRPAVYARVSSAISGAGDSEAALGLSARPFPSIPVMLLGELRATRSQGKLRPRPAAIAVTQLPPFALPAGLRGELYAQGGYVGGAGATAFADGQFTFDHALTRIAGHDLRIGGGAWGGAQRGAARVDVGPSARVDFKLGSRLFGRLALDYRLRVAGDADPGSGPALTASAGF